jgi:hypothetical protein
MELYKRYVEYGDKVTAFELFQARQTLARYGSFVRVRYCLQFLRAGIGFFSVCRL